MASSSGPPRLDGVVFDIDGVLVDSPHERAWRESLLQLMESDWRELRRRTSYAPERFTSAFYQEVMAGKPRLAGARAALEALGVPQAERRADEYAGRKQRQVAELIAAGQFHAYSDALRFLLAVKRAGLLIASASSSKNARPMLERIRLDVFAAEQGLDNPPVREGLTLMDAFDADVTGRDFARGKPDPMIFLAAAAELDLPPASCVVVEDAPAGIAAARAGGMVALAVARHHDAGMLREAGADLVVRSLDEVNAEALAHGRLEPLRPEGRVEPR
ncbi:MAG TPA: HAD-IA family hydrolase [Actinomycetes bacterium]|jgi:beta-phosphoglucomutase-like phosphatase (HAD superfamily)|nr:HAD-IA family hydrolase [Actinomycetes bacterium]